MSDIADRLTELGLTLPPPLVPPPGVRLPFRSVHVVGDLAYIAGHGPQTADGSLSPLRGKVGAQLTPEQGYQAARLTGLSILSSLARELGDLDRIAAWGRVFGMVNAAPGFDRLPEVINGFSDLVLDVFGPETGAHTRSAVGLAELPFGLPVEIEGQVHLRR
ncbi:RidA family protein [Actinoplanes sp. L3-i22]|uniref:RidA family protein n=1 Tax=Actinoplanes sp. L3-i22 TaxID=2836373 RepID=UPI001C784E09|nr:RidA family protein [Actinoplanes sp. L3-i22]BCY09476.1 LysR family transcriptional regulator [Actinoplanes sp. L3-i22]